MSAAVAASQDVTSRLADDTELRVLDAHTAALSGGLSTLATAALLAGIVNRANAAAAVLGDIGLAVQIEQASGQPTPPVGITATDDTERLTAALDTILTSDTDTAMQLSRLARAEPLSAAQDAATAALSAHPRVGGWVRQTNAGACELCRWWARGGHVRSVGDSFPRHPGCNCAVRITLTERTNRHAR